MSAPYAEGYKGALMHSAAWRGSEAYRGKRALVVGFGNSGSEIALDLWEHGANVSVLVRSPIHLVPRWLTNLWGLGIRPRPLARYAMPVWLTDALMRRRARM